MRDKILLAMGLVILALVIPRTYQPPRVEMPGGPRAPEPSVERILADVAALSAVPASSDDGVVNARVLSLLRDSLTDMGFAPQEQSFTLATGADSTSHANLYCLMPGRDHRRPWVLLNAHHDTSVNASGIAVMLETIRLLTDNPPDRGVVFLFSAAAEIEHEGVRHWTELPLCSRRGIGWALNIERVGRARAGARSLRLLGRNQGLPLLRHVREAARLETPEVMGWRLHLDDAGEQWGHGPILEFGIPAVSLTETEFGDSGSGQVAGVRAAAPDPLLMTAATRLVTAIALDPALPHPPR